MAEWRRWLAALRRTAHLMVGLPDYATYLEHVARRHPGQRPLDRAAFVHAHQEKRYGPGARRCC